MSKLLQESILIFFVFLSQVLSQQQIVFNHLTVDDGLSQSSVTCIFQDSKGFMWFGTQDGLNRYDGDNFTVFKNNPNDSTSLTDNFVFSIYEDQSDILYIETQGGNLHQYHPRSESFWVVEKGSINLSDAKFSTVGALFLESSGIRWTGGLGSGTGLKRLDTNTGHETIYTHDPADPFSLSSNKVYSVYKDRSGNLWVATFNGLDRFDEQSGKFFHFRNDPKEPNSLADNWVWPIYEDSKGNLWLGTVKSGICKFDPITNRFFNYRNDPTNPASINDNFIFSIYEDRSGLIWVGTNLGGVSYFNPSTQAFTHYKHDPAFTNSLSDDIVLSLLVDQRGDYWIGTRNGGLNKLNNRTQRFSHFFNKPSNPNSLISNSIQSLFEDRTGMIWIGTFSSGLDSFDPKSKQFTHYIHDPSNPSTLSDNRIYALAEDNESNIWIGTYGGGLNKLNKMTGKISHYQFNENDSSSINSNATWSMAFDDTGNLWIGTFGGGINVFDRANQIFHQFKNNPEDSTSIIDNNIIRVFKDSNGTLWIGTTKGLSRYDWETNTFKNYTEEDGLANNFIYGVVEDDNGDLWLSTNNGISKFQVEEEIFKNFYSEDGLQGNEFNQNAYAKDNITGKLLFGGLNGFNVFNPDSLKSNMYVTPVEFTGYLRYNTDDSEGKPIIEKGISERDTILLTHKDNIITLEFAALSFNNNLENQFKYKLEGFNDTWIQLGNNRSVTFTNLSAGEYNLRVIGSNNDSVWNEEGISLIIIASPPWWKTNFAYLIYIISFFSLLFGLRRYEINRREQKAQIRESALQIKAADAEKRALEIENERKTKEFEEARKLQLSMLPKKLPDLPDLEIAASMRTATEVGGDYYDFMVQDDGVLKVAFGDATGHGLQAGTMVTLMKGLFTSDASKLGFQEFLNHCSKIIKDINLGRILMSFTYIKIVDKKLQVTCAGMPPLYYYHSDSKEVEEIFIQGMPLGAMRNAEYLTTERQMKSGDTILLLTDGLPELMNSDNEMFDYSRVQKYFHDNIDESPQRIIEKLFEAGDYWIEGGSQEDDISFLVIKMLRSNE